MRTLHHLLLILPIAAIPAIADAECAPPPPPRGEMRAPPPPPPPIDISVCKDKTAGTVIETTTLDGRTIKGICQLVFLPGRPPVEDKSR